jgi:phosphate-selective porin OprO/OprP
MERAMPVTAFAGDFQQGLEYNWWNDNSGLQVSALLDTGKPTDVNDLDGDGKTDDNVDFTDEKFGVNARYSFAPILSESNTLHLGLWTRYINPPSGKVKVRSRPESHVTDTRLISTSISNVDGVNTSGVEVAWIGGPLSFQAEYQNQDISTTTGTDVTLNGYYVTGSYFLTGHTRNYDVGSGTIGRTKLNGEGAVELAIRYSELDLSEGSGGIGNNVTLGVNWWPRKNIKLAFNQIFAEVDQAGTAADEDIGISQVRAQIDF